jgi:hypothetical protein
MMMREVEIAVIDPDFNRDSKPLSLMEYAVGNPYSCRHPITGFILPVVSKQCPEGSRVLPRGFEVGRQAWSPTG